MEFHNIKVNGKIYSLTCDDGDVAESRGTLRIYNHTDNEIVTDQSGYCNPFISFWQSSDTLLRGAAKQSKIAKIAKNCVTHEIEQKKIFEQEQALEAKQ
ncbi:MAG: hypothetical protein ACKO0Z_20240 [Betaproteobacteria bacterium]